MSGRSYLHLKSGTDVRGVAIACEGHPLTLTDEAVKDIIHAFLFRLSKKTGKTKLKIAVGYDCRLSSEHIDSIVKNEICGCGCDVIACGMSSTPSMFMLLQESGYACDGSVMITASHLPYYMNGLKFFTVEGGLDGEDIKDVLTLAESGARPEGKNGNAESRPFMDSYCKTLVETVRKATGATEPLSGRKIIVDAGNGVGGFFAERVLIPLGADCGGSVNLQPDGHFPAHAPNPEDKEAISALQSAVKAAGAELGIIFDTDVDRAAIVDGDGCPINRDRLIALLAAELLNGGAGTIVTDSVTSDGLTEFIEKLGGKHVRYMRGYKNVIDEAKRRNDSGEYCPLAIETSGHAAFKENYFLDDGAYLICKLLVLYSRLSKDGKKLSDLISGLALPAEEKEIRIKFNAQSRDFKKEGNNVIEDLKRLTSSGGRVTLSACNYEGARINFKDGDGAGWTLVRMSVHDPVLPINFASREEGGIKIMAAYLYDFLSAYPFLDLSALTSFLNN